MPQAILRNSVPTWCYPRSGCKCRFSSASHLAAAWSLSLKCTAPFLPTKTTTIYDEASLARRLHSLALQNYADDPDADVVLRAAAFGPVQAGLEICALGGMTRGGAGWGRICRSWWVCWLRRGFECGSRGRGGGARTGGGKGYRAFGVSFMVPERLAMALLVPPKLHYPRSSNNIFSSGKKRARVVDNPCTTPECVSAGPQRTHTTDKCYTAHPELRPNKKLRKTTSTNTESPAEIKPITINSGLEQVMAISPPRKRRLGFLEIWVS